MKPNFNNALVKMKISIPFIIGIVTAVAIITLNSVNKTKKAVYSSLERDLSLELVTIKKMFEREHLLKLENVKMNLRFMLDKFNENDFNISEEKKLISAVNQLNGDTVEVYVNKWFINGENISENFNFVDNISKLTNSTATLFSRTDKGYLRLSTNVTNKSGLRAVNTYIPYGSEVIKTIENGNSYYGRAYVVNDWYITAYHPVYKGDSIVGMLYVGNKEKELENIDNILSSFKIGQSGSLFVTDNFGHILITNNIYRKIDSNVFSEVFKNKSGSFQYFNQTDNDFNICAYDYHPEFDLYIIAEINSKDETRKLINSIIRNAIIVSLIVILIFSGLVFFLTAEKIQNYIFRIKAADDKLNKTKQELKLSEERFKTLFDSSSDEIFVSDLSGKFIEINKVACDSLEYSKEELLKMKFYDLKTPKYRHTVKENITKVLENGNHTYETENVSKSGQVFQVEMKSRIILYNGNDAIMCVSRNISERKKLEKKILSTIIETEEKERKRFAADLHDDLGPILSAIKLYVDLVAKDDYKNTDKSEVIKDLNELVDLAISSTRDISNNITPGILYDFGLATAVNEFCGYINKSKSINILFKTQDYHCIRKGIEETVLYQTIKELINNTIKHASAQNITIELKSLNNQIILYYRDDGIGFNVSSMLSNSPGLGLNNIMNKIKTVKGTCDFNSTPGNGMFILIAVKIDDEKI